SCDEGEHGPVPIDGPMAREPQRARINDVGREGKLRGGCMAEFAKPVKSDFRENQGSDLAHSANGAEQIKIASWKRVMPQSRGFRGIPRDPRFSPANCSTAVAPPGAVPMTRMGRTTGRPPARLVIQRGRSSASLSYILVRDLSIALAEFLI